MIRSAVGRCGVGRTRSCGNASGRMPLLLLARSPRESRSRHSLVLATAATATPTQQQRRLFTPMTREEEEREKKRVAGLSAFAKDQELRRLNRELAVLEMKKGILTGELYTWSGRYRQLARDYGLPLFAWYWAAWTVTCALSYGAITAFDIDTLALLAKVDGHTGWNLVNHVDPELGKIGMAVVMNEMLEPIRLPFVIVTVKPVVDRVFPPKY